MINSAHEVFKAIGGTANVMVDAEFLPRKSGERFRKANPSLYSKIYGGKQVAGQETKLHRNLRKRYSHILSDFIAYKNMEVIHQCELKEVA